MNLRPEEISSVIKDEIKHAVVAEKLGINVVMLYRWISEYETYGNESFVGKGRLRSPDAEMKKLLKVSAN